MAIEKIDYELCTGCGICVNSYPMDVFRLDKDKIRRLSSSIRRTVCCAGGA